MKTILLFLACSISINGWGEDIIKTNLPAQVTVSVSTNIVNGDNSKGCNICFDKGGHFQGFTPAVFGIEPCQPYHPATERWIVTNIIRTEIVILKWRNGIVMTNETLLSSTTNHWKLASEWRKER